MKIKQSSKGGGIAIALLLFVTTLSILLGGYTKFSQTNAHMTRRVLAFQQAGIVAEGAVGAGASILYNLIELDGFPFRISVLQNKLDISVSNSLSIAEISGYTVDFLDVQVLSVSDKILEVSVIAGASSSDGVAHNAIQAIYKVNGERFVDYSIFTADKFELYPHGTMNIRGKIRTNSSMHIGNDQGYINLYGNAWAANGFFVTDVQSAQKFYAETETGSMHNFFDGRITDSLRATWDALSSSIWGEDINSNQRIQAKAGKLLVPIDAGDNRIIIEPYDPSDSSNSTLLREKLSEKSRRSGGLYVTVAADGSISVLEAGFSKTFDPATEQADIAEKDPLTGIYSMKSANSNGWIEVQDDFKDAYDYLDMKKGDSVDKNVRIVNIYADNLLKKYPGTSILYVEIEDENGDTIPYNQIETPSSSTTLQALRIRNGDDISAAGSSGFTIATHRTTYLEGNFNAHGTIPALILADNLTALSNNWDDSNAALYRYIEDHVDQLKNKVMATDTAYKCAFMIGGVEYSIGTPALPSDGLQNLIRRREDWDGGAGWAPAKFITDGSLVKLWNAQETTGNTRGRGAGAPIREYSFDSVHSGAPGVPVGLETPSILRWERLSWQEAKEMVLNR